MQTTVIRRDRLRATFKTIFSMALRKTLAAAIACLLVVLQLIISAESSPQQGAPPTDIAQPPPQRATTAAAGEANTAPRLQNGSKYGTQKYFAPPAGFASAAEYCRALKTANLSTLAALDKMYENEREAGMSPYEEAGGPVWCALDDSLMHALAAGSARSTHAASSRPRTQQSLPAYCTLVNAVVINATTIESHHHPSRNNTSPKCERSPSLMMTTATRCVWWRAD